MEIDYEAKYKKIVKKKHEASERYRQKYPEVFRKNAQRYYEKNKSNPEFMEKKRESARAYALKKKLEKKQCNNEIVEIPE